MKRSAATLLAVFALAGADASAKGRDALYGIAGGRSELTLVQLDPDTLRRLPGRQLRLGPATAAAAVVRGGDLAYADGYRLRLIDLDTLKPFGNVRVSTEMPRAVAWLDWRWVVVVLNGEIVVVDRSVMRVARRTILRGQLVAYERTPTDLVLLMAPQEGIGPARLVVVDPRGRLREIALERVVAGWHWDSMDPPSSESRSPGLAVDPERRIAYVVGADGLVAEVPLDGAARYHAVRGAYAKIVRGSWRTAEWLGRGMLAVAGTNSPDGRTSNPSGAELVDTRTWSSRFVLPRATNVVQWQDGFLATGPNVGLVAVRRDGTERFRLFGSEQVWLAAVTSTRAYVYADGNKGAYVVDLLGGGVSPRLGGQRPWTWLLPTQVSALWP